MFDKSYLAPAHFEFVIVSDSHFILDPEPYAIEFDSVREWSQRAEWALKLAVSLESDFVLHLGDLAEENPARENYLEVRHRARAQMQRDGIDPYWVAGNMDIGDKPDATMWTDWVSERTLAIWEQHHSKSWYSFDHGGVHFVVLNSQIINGSLSQAAEQHTWFEQDLDEHVGERIIVFLHMPPFFVDEDEPDKGFYNSLDEPGRSWLTGLMRQHRVELLFSGHTHFRAFNRIDGTRFYVAPSTTTSRAGFSEAFSVAPAPEQGRNDKAKLGFFLVRVNEADTRIHFIRTHGETGPAKTETGWSRFLTRTSPDLAGSPVGIFLRTPLAHQAAGAVAWPSLLRQRVRDDHPFLSCLELGARHVRVPASDLDDELQIKRLALLRAEGVEVTVFWLWSERLNLYECVEGHAEHFDAIELKTPGSLWPSDHCVRELARSASHFGKPVTLTPVLPREKTGGKYHPRTRIGYHTNELSELDLRLTKIGVQLDRVLIHIDEGTGPWDTLCTPGKLLPLTSVASLDFVAPAHQVAEAVFASATYPGCRLFIDPYVDLDRTNDAVHGLLDRLSNPRPAFHCARMLNTILFAEPTQLSPCDVQVAGPDRVLGLAGEGRRLWLLLPDGSTVDDRSFAGIDLEGPVSIFDLEKALSRRYVSSEREMGAAVADVRGPCLISSTGLPST